MNRPLFSTPKPGTAKWWVREYPYSHEAQRATPVGVPMQARINRAIKRHASSGGPGNEDWRTQVPERGNRGPQGELTSEEKAFVCSAYYVSKAKQLDIAEVMGISQQTVSYYLAGKRL